LTAYYFGYVYSCSRRWIRTPWDKLGVSSELRMKNGPHGDAVTRPFICKPKIIIARVAPTSVDDAREVTWILMG